MTTRSLSSIQQDIQTHSPHPEKVKILAVSKKQSFEKIIELHKQGQILFGENYVQEALQKIQQTQQHLSPKDQLTWHFIGHLQSNKVKDIIGKFKLIHSVDSLKLAQIIDQKCKALNIKQDILIEINIGEESSKNGFRLEELTDQWKQLIQLTNLSIHGLMCLPPPSEDDRITSSYFKKLKDQQVKLKSNTPSALHPMNELSMGTSSDYILALQQGSTFIRLGTILFGERA
ncbi:MAG: YggS family pyridoxal phosphate-dependent enzyme [Bdellovibrionales bacterium]|nr:YggS family pyridoxal phosphate-dependent enzyme [Bdellovibrionales bacterium]